MTIKIILAVEQFLLLLILNESSLLYVRGQSPAIFFDQSSGNIGTSGIFR